MIFRFLLLAVLILASTANAQKFDNLARTPPMGWNSWNTFQVRIDEKLIKETADAMIKNGMRDAGYVYINLDDGWSTKQRDKDGNLIGDPDRFPSGMKALGDYLHQRGFKFGIYNCAGTQTCAGYPGGKDHDVQDAKTYASWGVDYLKYDWCNTEGLKAPEEYPKMRDGLRAAGRPMVFSICEWGQSEPWKWAGDVGHLWRTTGDIEPKYESWKKILDKQAGLEKFAGPGHWNDPDMLEVGNGSMTLAESRAHFTLWCMLAAPLLAGNDVRNMKPEIRDILTNRDVIAIDQDPLGKQAFRAAVKTDHEIWVKELSNGRWAVCVLNTSSEPCRIEMTWSDFPMIRGNFSVADVWQKRQVSDTKRAFSGELASHDVLVLLLTPAR